MKLIEKMAEEYSKYVAWDSLYTTGTYEGDMGLAYLAGFRAAREMAAQMVRNKESFHCIDYINIGEEEVE